MGVIAVVVRAAFEIRLAGVAGAGKALAGRACSCPWPGAMAICVHLALLRPARPEGLGAVFYRAGRVGAALLAIALLAATGWAALGIRGLAAVAASLGRGAAPGRLRPRQTRRRHRRHPRRRLRNRRSRSRLDLDPGPLLLR